MDENVVAAAASAPPGARPSRIGASRTEPEDHMGNWENYRFVHAIHRYGSIGAAACALDVTDATVSRRLRRIELDLGFPVFDRVGGRCVATPEATDLIGLVVRVGDLFNDVRSVLPDQKASAGPVRVTTAASLVNHVLVPRVSEFLALHPGLELELAADTAPLSITRQRETDIAIRLDLPSTEQDVIARRIGTLVWATYAHGSLPDGGREAGWIAYAPRCAGLPQAAWIEERRARRGGEVAVRVDNPESLLRAVRAGLGRTLLPRPLAARFPELACLDGAERVVERTLWMLVHPSSREVCRLQTVGAWLAEVLGEFLREDPLVDGG